VVRRGDGLAILPVEHFNDGERRRMQHIMSRDGEEEGGDNW